MKVMLFNALLEYIHCPTPFPFNLHPSNSRLRRRQQKEKRSKEKDAIKLVPTEVDGLPVIIAAVV